MGGSTECLLPFGGDFSLDSTGDLVLISDDANASPATEQRIIQMLLTNPVLRDANNRPIGPPDDIFNPTNGIGEGRLVGAKASSANAVATKAAILKGLSSFPELVKSPAPVVAVTFDGAASFLVSISAQTVTGKTISIPSQRLSTITS
jgi:hypothetical protein